MDLAVAPGLLPASNNFQDGLGERRRSADAGGESIELLCLRKDLTSIPSFEFALRERTSRLAAFRHTYFGRVRSIDRLADAASTLAVASDLTRGVRLSQLLTPTDRRPVAIDINAALHLIRQLVNAVAMLHENARDVAHGAIGPERVIVTSNARVVIVEYVLGAALEQLRFSHERYWRELRVAAAPSASLPTFDQRTDITQVGVVALSLVLGRLLTEDEFPDGVGDVLASASAISAQGGHEPLPHGIRAWLGRALQLDPRHAFESAIDAQADLDKVLSGEEDDEDDYLSNQNAPGQEAYAEAPEPIAAVLLQPEPVELAPHSSHEAINLEFDLEFRSAFIAPEPQAVATPSSELMLPPVMPDSAGSAHAPVWTPPISIAPAAELDEDDGEELRAQLQPPHSPSGQRWTRIGLAAAALICVSLAGTVAVRRFSSAAPATVSTGTLNISTNPPGALVIIDNESRGATPLTLTLGPGAHVVELRGNGEPRTIPVTIAAGAQTSQYIEMPAAPVVGGPGQLNVRTDPAGAKVTVDGVARGKSPVLIDSLVPGEHVVMLESDFGTVKHTVSVESAATASLVVPLTAGDGAPPSGWVSLSAPVEVQIFENKRLLGTSQSDRLMVSSGRHEFEIVNEPLGYHAVTVIQVPAGKVAPIKIEWPTGSVALNAVPWAEVWIDGEKLGETPIGNLSLPIGPHEAVFRHPDLGEQRYPVSVSLKAPARVSVDMRKKP
jgi:serine/threonine protein kinase